MYPSTHSQAEYSTPSIVDRSSIVLYCTVLPTSYLKYTVYSTRYSRLYVDCKLPGMALYTVHRSSHEYSMNNEHTMNMH